ncbi:MAG TPA: efflux RND transporter permease subunit, partial [Gemmatimonadaceae bacterium]
MFLSDISIKRPVFATMLMAALVTLGVVSYQRLAIDEYPDITYPVIIAQTAWLGASSEVMQREVSKPIEEALNTVQGLKEIGSTSLEGSSIVRLQFNLDVDVAEAQQDVQAKVARIRRTLPEDIEDPIILRFDPNERPIMSLAVQSDARPLRELTDLADEVISTRIESVPGVGGVNVVGGTERQIQILLDPDAIRAYGVSPEQIVQALQRENQEVPAGRIERGDTERLIRVTGRIVDPKSFADIVVAMRASPGGAAVPIRLGTLGTVVDGMAEKRSSTQISGADAVGLDILKISGSNTVQVADAVRGVAAELERQLPGDVRLTVIRDDSQRIREGLHDVQLTLVLGALLTILIIYFFLNSWRSTVITGLTLPVSIISAFFGMWVFGFTVNTMTLLALSLAIGLLIDDAIVVRENIVRHIEMGKDHHRAAKEGTDEIGLAVMATTLAVVAVFVPVAFMGGQIGKIFFQFGVTVAFAVLVSLFVSFTLDPMLSSVWPDPEVVHGEAELAEARRTAGPVRRVAFAFNDWFDRVAERYPPLLRWALHHRAWVAAGASLSILVAFLLLPRLGFTWMPDYDGSEFTVNFRTAPGSSLDYTVGKGREIGRMLEQRPEVEFTRLSVGGGFRGTPNNGSVYVRLVKPDARGKSQEEITTEVRGALRGIPGVRPFITGSQTIFGGWRQPIIVQIQGPEPSRLKLAAARVLEGIRDVPGVAEPNSSDDGELPQLDVVVDREAAWSAGLGVGSIAATLQPLFAGRRATQWEDPLGYSHDVVVQYPSSLRDDPENIATIPVPSTNVDPATGRPRMVPLAQVAEVRPGIGPQAIERSSLQRQISISAGVLPGHTMGDVAAAVRARVDSLGLPPGYRAVFSGDVQNLEETKGYVLEAILLAVVFIYLILASLFGSFTQPLAIMLSLPLSFIGVALALLVTGGNLNVMTMIGIIMLLGLVTKNGILLVDFANQQREAGMDRETALLTSARIRLRPIIMTTAAMIFGMLPLALAIGEGAEQRAPMAHAVIGGLITSTLLTLLVVPVVYATLEDAVRWLAGR